MKRLFDCHFIFAIILLSSLILSAPVLARPDLWLNRSAIETRLRDDNTSTEIEVHNSRNLGAEDDLEWAVEVGFHDEEDADWLELSRNRGTIRAGGNQTIRINFDGRELEAEHGYVDLFFTSNDPTRLEQTVPLVGHNVDYPRIRVAWNEAWEMDEGLGGIDMNHIFEVITYGETRQFNINISNPGSAVLHVEEVRSSNGYWEFDPPAFELDPDRNLNVTAIFTAEYVGQNSTTITSVSNAWDPAEFEFRIIAVVEPIFILDKPIADLVIDEDSGEHLVADLDTVFFSSSRPTYSAEGDGVRFQIERNGELSIQPSRNFFGESVVTVQALSNDSTLINQFTVSVLGINDAPGGFDLASPSNGDSLIWDDYDSLFVWTRSNDVDGDSIFYELSIWTEGQEEPYLISDLKDTTYPIQIVEHILDPTLGGQFFWTVKANDGTVEQNAWSTFTNYLGSNRVQNSRPLLPSTLELVAVYPNPFNSIVTITCRISVPGMITIDLVDLQGHHCQTLYQGTVLAGTFTKSLAANNLVSGLYFIRLTSGSQTQLRKILLIK